MYYDDRNQIANDKYVDDDDDDDTDDDDDNDDQDYGART